MSLIQWPLLTKFYLLKFGKKCRIASLCLGNQNEQVAFELFEAALILQHWGQDLCGIATSECRIMFCQ